MSEEKKTVELKEDELEQVSGGLSYKQTVNGVEKDIEIKPGMFFTTAMEPGETCTVLIVQSEGLLYKISNGYTRSHLLTDLKPTFINID